MSDSKTTYEQYLREMTVAAIINKDIDLSEMMADMKVYLKRKGAGINDNGFKDIIDHIDMLSSLDDNHPVLKAQIVSAQNLFSKCLPYILAQVNNER